MQRPGVFVVCGVSTLKWMWNVGLTIATSISNSG